MSDAVVEMPTPAEPDAAPFAAAAVEGPFGYKPDRNRPIEPHFDGFGGLTPEQAREVLDVRDGRRPRCVLRLAGESVLVEHAGQGYTDPATGVAWGYRVRRVGHDRPPAAAVPVSPPEPTPPPARVELTAASPVSPLPAAVLPRPSVVAPPPPVVVPRPSAGEGELDLLDGLADLDDSGAEWAAHWTAPARSPRAVALADPAERAAVVRVLILWFVVAVLLAQCVAVLAQGR